MAHTHLAHSIHTHTWHTAHTHTCLQVSHCNRVVYRRKLPSWEVVLSGYIPFESHLTRLDLWRKKQILKHCMQYTSLTKVKMHLKGIPDQGQYTPRRGTQPLKRCRRYRENARKRLWRSRCMERRTTHHSTDAKTQQTNHRPTHMHVTPFKSSNSSSSVTRGKPLKPPSPSRRHSISCPGSPEAWPLKLLASAHSCVCVPTSQHPQPSLAKADPGGKHTLVEFRSVGQLSSPCACGIITPAVARSRHRNSEKFAISIELHVAPKY